MKTEIKRIQHRGENRIGVFLNYGDRRILDIKNIENSKWSASKKCWHLPDNKENIEKLKQIFPELLKRTSTKSTELSHQQEKILNNILNIN